MPGSVAAAAPALVLPFSLCKSYRQSRTWEVRVNEYPDGSSQRFSLVTTSRKRWVRSVRIAGGALLTMRAFYEARRGWLEPFYFYDLWETTVKFTWDPSGVATTGRYTVRFASPWEQTTDWCRSDVGMELVEIA
jgi:hypothetical protein